MAAACGGNGRAAPAPAPVSTATCDAGDPRRLVAASGEDPNHAALFDVDVCTGRASRIGNHTRISSLATAGATVAVSAAPVNVDQMYLLRGSELRPVAGTSAPLGSAPAVSPDGRRVAYIALGQRGTSAFLVQLVSGGRLTTLYRSARPLGALAFVASGELLVAEIAEEVGVPASTGNARVLAVSPSGSARTVASLPTRIVTGMAVSGKGQIAVSGAMTDPGLVLDGKGAVVATLLPGLRVQAFLRGGDLLVVRGDRVGRLAVTAPASGEPRWLPTGLAGEVVSVRER